MLISSVLQVPVNTCSNASRFAMFSGSDSTQHERSNSLLPILLVLTISFFFHHLDRLKASAFLRFVGLGAPCSQNSFPGLAL